MNADALAAFVALVALGVFFYGPWQVLCVDVARQLMFEQRDRLFDMARDGLVSFDAPAYRELRESMQRSIRFAHDLTFTRMAYLFFARYTGRSRQTGMDLAISAMPEGRVRSEAWGLARRCNRILIGSVLVRSLSFWMLLPVVLSAAIAAYVFVRVRLVFSRIAKSMAHAVQIEADTYGALH